jgi:hypothetical protein
MTCDNENGDLEELRRMDACTNCTRLSVEIAQLCEDKLIIAAERDKWHFEYDNLAKFATQYERERDVARGDRDDLCELLKAAEARAEEAEAKATLYAASLDKGGWDDLARDLREKLAAAEARAESLLRLCDNKCVALDKTAAQRNRLAEALREEKQARIIDAAFIEKLKAAARCQFCKKPATCVGAYEGNEKPEFACDDCCGHGNEDGWCLSLDDEERYRCPACLGHGGHGIQCPSLTNTPEPKES